MLIACPKCQRKYQIDTSRIPAGGTTFTCWTCRASVPVMREGMETTPPEPPKPVSGPEAGVPGSAMRFFESLADEAKTRRTTAPLAKPEDEARAPEPPRHSGPLWPPRQPEPPRPAPQTRIQAAPVAAIATGAAIDFDASDNILDIPSFTSRTAAPAPVTDSILELPVSVTGSLPELEPEPEPEPEPEVLIVTPEESSAPRYEPEPPSDVVISYSIDESDAASVETGSALDAVDAALEAADVSPARTLAMESPAFPEPDPARTIAMFTPVAHRAEEPAELGSTTEPIPMAVQRRDEPIDSARTAAFASPRFDALANEEPAPPPAPEPPRTELPRPHMRPRPPRPTMPQATEPVAPPAPTTIPMPAVAAPAAKTPEPPSPPDPLFAAPALTPGQMGGDQATWVSPAVDAATPRRRGWALPAIAAALVLGVAGVVGAMFLLPQFSTRPGQPAAVSGGDGPQQAASTELAQSAPAPEPAAPQPTKQAPQSTAQEPAKTPPASTAPASGSGGYTLQVASNPDRAASDAVASELRGRGFDAYVVQAEIPGRGTWYRVRVGRFDSQAEAKAALQRLRSTGTGAGAIVTAYGG